MGPVVKDMIAGVCGSARVEEMSGADSLMKETWMYGLSGNVFILRPT